MEDKYQNQEQDRRLGELEKKMDAVFSHIAKTNEEMGKVCIDMAWLKRFFWIIATASISGLMAIVFNVILTIGK